MKKAFGLKIVFIALLTLFLALGTLVSFAESHPDRMVNDDEIISADEAEYIRNYLNKISEETGIDIAVVAINGTPGRIGDYADSFYDNNGYGLGSDKSGIMLVHDPLYRNWYVTTLGKGYTIVTDDALEYIEENIVPYLQEYEFAKAYKAFADTAYNLSRAYVFDGVIYGTESYNGYFRYEKPRLITPMTVIIALVIGLIGGFSNMSAAEKKMKTVLSKANASDYVVENSLNLTEQKDIYLYSTVSKVRKSTSSSGSGSHGGGGHSGGHGGGGGHY